MRLAAEIACKAPKRVLFLFAVFAAFAAVFGSSAADALKPSGFDDPASEGIVARHDLERATGLNPDVNVVALVAAPRGIGSPATRKKVANVTRVIRRQPESGRVETYYSTRDKALVSRNRRSTLVVAGVRPVPHDQMNAFGRRLVKHFANDATVKLGGLSVGQAQVADIIAADLRRAELIAFPLLLLLSLIFFRSAVAAVLPLVIGGLAILGALLGLKALAQFTDVSIFALNLVIALGLALAIDYSLLVVSRYREEMAQSGPGRTAIQRTLETAGRTVCFSALTVAAALAALLVFPQTFLYSMGMGGALVTVFAALISVVLLPAILSLLGPRVNALSPPFLRRAADAAARPAQEGGWYRLAQFVSRRPVPIAIVISVLLIVLGIPSLGVRITSAEAIDLPRTASTRQVDEAMVTSFPRRPSPFGRVTIFAAVDAPRTPTARRRIEAYAHRIHRLDGLPAVSAELVARHMWQVQIVQRYPSHSQRSEDLVRSIRKVRAPYPTGIGGDSTSVVDQKESLASRLPLALVIATAVTLVVLFLMTRSITLPIKAVIMNVLTLSAAYGVLALIFQDGRLEEFLDYTSKGALDNAQLMVICAVVFGLSTDYGVFLLGRIKEAHDAGMSNRNAVAIGLERAGRIVTAAALLFCVAILAFATSQVLLVKQFSVGIAVAVAIDATVVRALLVPSLMALLGDLNWWAPNWLRRRE